jgi:hypothetical protein
MADRAQGSISFTPIVTLDSDADADSLDTIHHNIKSSLGGELTFTARDADDHWFYAPNVIVLGANDEELFGDTDNATDLAGASGDQVNGPNEAAGAAVTFTNGDAADCNADKVWFLFIKNTGTSDTSGTTTTNSIYFTLDDNDSTAHSTTDAIEVAAGEAWMSKINGVIMDDIHIIAGQAGGAGTASTVNGSQDVRCTVAAIIEDV